MRLSTRELVVIAAFGSLWGAVEVGLGGTLKALHVPFSGLILACLGLGIVLTARLFVPRRGSILFMGLITVLIKLFNLNSIILGPVIGIMAEALLAELVLSTGARPRRPMFLVAGALGVLWALAQPLVTGPLFFGRSVVAAWAGMIEQGSELLGLPPEGALVIAAALAGLYVLAGLLTGGAAWHAGHLVQKRLGRAPAYDTGSDHIARP